MASTKDSRNTSVWPAILDSRSDILILVGVVGILLS